MPKLPRVSGAIAVKVFRKCGWSASRQKGSHVVMTKKGSIYSLSIPQHKELGPGLLRTLLRKSGMSVEDFIHYLK